MKNSIKIHCDRNDIASLFKEGIDKIVLGYHLSVDIQNAEICIQQNKDYKCKIGELFSGFFDLMFLCLGHYPKIIGFFENEEKKENLLSKFTTSISFSRKYFCFIQLTSEIITDEIIKKIIDFNKENNSLVSFGYILSASYENIMWEHKLTLLTHILDGIYNFSNEELAYIKNNYYTQYKEFLGNVDKDDVGDFPSICNEIFSKTFFKYKDIVDKLYKLLGVKNNFCFIDKITQTRNFYSHMKNKKLSNNRINANLEKSISYIYVLYIIIRLYVLDILNISIDEAKVVESFSCIHDWIKFDLHNKLLDIKHIESNTYMFFAYWDKIRILINEKNKQNNM